MRTSHFSVNEYTFSREAFDATRGRGVTPNGRYMFDQGLQYNRPGNPHRIRPELETCLASLFHSRRHCADKKVYARFGESVYKGLDC